MLSQGLLGPEARDEVDSCNKNTRGIFSIVSTLVLVLLRGAMLYPSVTLTFSSRPRVSMGNKKPKKAAVAVAAT